MDKFFRVVTVVLATAATVQLYMLSREPEFVPADIASLARIDIGAVIPDVPVEAVPSSLAAQNLARTSTTHTFLGETCVVLFFFRSNCVSCQAVAPKWSNLNTVERDGQFARIVPVGLDQSSASILDFIEKYDLAKPAFRIPSSNSVSELGIAGVPIAYLLDRSGVVTGFAHEPSDVDLSTCDNNQSER